MTQVASFVALAFLLILSEAVSFSSVFPCHVRSPTSAYRHGAVCLVERAKRKAGNLLQQTLSCLRLNPCVS